jgi:hypothetical protein
MGVVSIHRAAEKGSSRKAGFRHWLFSGTQPAYGEPELLHSNPGAVWINFTVSR